MTIAYCRGIIFYLIFLSLGASASQFKFDEERFKNSLKPAVIFQEKNKVFRLRDRMGHYGASGVSVAVIKNIT